MCLNSKHYFYSVWTDFCFNSTCICLIKILTEVVPFEEYMCHYRWSYSVESRNSDALGRHFHQTILCAHQPP